MPNPENLKPFKKGDKRASEAGKKSKRKPLEEQWRIKLEKAMSSGKGNKLDVLFNVLMKEAINGDVRATKELLDRAYGRAKQILEHSGIDGDPIQNKIEIEFKD